MLHSGTASGSDTGVRWLVRCPSAPVPITKSIYRSPATLPQASTPLEEVVVRIVQTQETSVSSRPVSPSRYGGAASGDDPRTQVDIVETYEAEDQLIRQIGLALLAEALTSEPIGRLYAESLAQTLALHLVRHYSVSRRAAAMFQGGLSGYNLRRAKEFINQHLEQDLTLTCIADAVGLSRFHFAGAFKLATNLTPQQYLTERRVELAKLLLRESDLPLVEVSARAGFKSQSHFTTLFRRFTGTTPKAWRQSRLT
jgi:AraC family transcriptional regulator